MRISLIFFILFFLPFVNASEVDPHKEYRVALVIGNSAYPDAPLKNPINDAKKIAASLRKAGFQVILGRNLDRESILAKAEEFKTLLEKADTGLFYFAGHGLQYKGDNFLVPIDARFYESDDIPHEALSTNTILDKMDEVANAVNIVILDACRNNPFSFSTALDGENRGLKRKDQKNKTPKTAKEKNITGLARINAPAGSFVAYATAPGQVAEDGQGDNGMYTQYLLQYIKQPDLPIEQVFKKVRINVVRDTRGKQVPWENSALLGDFYFIQSKISKPKIVRPKTQQIAQIKPEPWTDPEFAKIKAGCFIMGSPFGEEARQNNELDHEICLSQDFLIGKYEVTQAQWKAIMGKNPAYFKGCGKDCPVEQVSWNEVQRFIQQLNQQSTGVKYRLPTEAEWEYAARSGTQTSTYIGDLEKEGANNAPELDRIAWYSGNAGVEYKGGKYCEDWEDKQYDAIRCGTHPVGKKEPNAWGLYDILGNVLEWTADGYGAYSSRIKRDPKGKKSRFKVVRGGDWSSALEFNRAASRAKFKATTRLNNLGFRLVKIQ